MKAIFAVSALAAAISAQAIAADTEATTTFTGAISYETTFDIDAEDRSMSVGDESLAASIAVKNGGFSGTLSIDEEGDTDEGEGFNEITVSDLQYQEGPFLFGQGIGSIVSTAGAVGTMSTNTDYDAADGFRYTNEDMGLKVQLEAGDTDIDEDGDTDNSLATDFGLAAAYMADLDVATVTVDAQYREANSATKGADTMTRPYVGAKVEASPIDMLTVTAGVTMGGEGVDKFLEDDEGGANTTSYGVRGDVTVMEGLTAYAYYSDNLRDGVADNEAKVGAEFVLAPLTLSASHAMQLEAETATTEAAAVLSQDFAVSDALTVNAHAKATWETDTDVVWEAGADATYAVSAMVSAYAGYELIESGDESEATAGVVYTTEGGATMSADYRNASADYDDDGLEHTFKLKAAYSF